MWNKGKGWVPPGFLGLGFLIFLLQLGFSFSEDVIQFPNYTTGETGVLVDGDWFGIFYNDERFSGAAGQDILMWNFTSNPGEIIAFAAGNAPVIKEDNAITWSWDQDIVKIDFNGPLSIDVAIWLVTVDAVKRLNAGDFEYLCWHASYIWEVEGRGLIINCLPPVDVTGRKMVDGGGRPLNDDFGNPITDGRGHPISAGAYYANHPFDCGAGELARIKQVAHKPQMLNVYFTHEVASGDVIAGSSYGLWCQTIPDNDVIAMGSDTDITVLSHEIGHALMNETGHVDKISVDDDSCSIAECFFDRMNVMHGASSIRWTVTEGQIFRAFYNQDGILNQIYGIGPGGSLNHPRKCGTWIETDKPDCPPVQKRLWPDEGVNGTTWPPN